MSKLKVTFFTKKYIVLLSYNYFNWEENSMIKIGDAYGQFYCNSCTSQKIISDDI